MAQSESKVSDNPPIDTISSIEKELNSLEKQSVLRTCEVDIGDPVCAVANPTVETLIIGKTTTQSRRIEFLLLIPPYERKGEATTPAAVLRKDQEKISKRKVRKFVFPMLKVEKWRTLAIKNKTDYSWTAAALQVLNGNGGNIELSPMDTSTRLIDNNQVLTDEVVENKTPQTDKQIIQQLRQKVSELQEKRTVHMDFPLCPDSEFSVSDDSVHFQRNKINRRKKSKSKRKMKKSRMNKKSRKHHLTSTDETTQEESDSESEFTSSSSDGSSSSDDNFVCPFSQQDCRGSKHLKAKMKGRKTERKYLRWALQNLYSTFHSLKCVVNDIRSQSLANGTKPLTFDLIWLEQHAIYLDTLLFDSFRGVWRQWNELVVDQLALAFLELLVRVSPRKEYSDHLDERVRKWMKRKRIGLSQRFGPVPAYLQQAKITEVGILVPANNMQRKWSTANQNNQILNNFKQQQKPPGPPAIRQYGAQTSKPPVST